MTSELTVTHFFRAGATHLFMAYRFLHASIEHLLCDPNTVLKFSGE